ncbi:hypothetical protein F7725_019568 [Dissostichus mawsoni]|uniref:LysM domain-containing protein n=1 Tax=Dissostichus mawsoni TaxID=36200 RepID=A0A7J5YM61_DISMA|nr:hypothetical protein F7725_019568 [Dissostichus mawsoni]
MRSAGLETVEDRAIKGGRRPRSTHVRAHVSRVRAVIRPAEAPGAIAEWLDTGLLCCDAPGVCRPLSFHLIPPSPSPSFLPLHCLLWTPVIRTGLTSGGPAGAGGPETEADSTAEAASAQAVGTEDPAHLDPVAPHVHHQNTQRLKRRRQLKQSQSEKSVTDQNPAIISWRPHKTTDLQRMISKPPACPGKTCYEIPKHLENWGSFARGCSENGCKSTNRAKKEKQRPPGTVEFTVGANDSLNSIALKFNVTPNNLVQLNKLFSRSVYPGQKLFVPDVSQSETELKSSSSTDPAFRNGLSEKASHDGISKGKSAKSLRHDLSPNSEDESPATVKFIKMSCKYFTDGMGVVGGVLIVTPNNIMFDPHKSDPLVIEHGCEEYGLICPMQEVVSVALYDDVSRMKLKDALPSPGEWEQLPSERDLNPFSRYEALGPKRPIVLDDIESTLSETGNIINVLYIKHQQDTTNNTSQIKVCRCIESKNVFLKMA